MTHRPLVLVLALSAATFAAAADEQAVAVKTASREIDLGTMKAVSGKEFRVPEGQENRGDVYVCVNTVRIDGVVAGDLLAGAGVVRVPGRVGRDLTAVAGEVLVDGDVEGRLRTLARRTELGGEVGADAVIVAGSAVLKPGAVVRGSLAVYAGSAKLEGSVDGPAYIGAGQVEINGRFAGDVTVNCDELRLGPAARLEGALTYTARNPAKIPEGAVAGAVTRRSEPVGEEGQAGREHFWKSRAFRAAMSLYLAFVALIAGGLLLLFFRPTVDGALSRTTDFSQLAVSFGIGLVALLAMLVVGVLCCLLFPLVLAIWSALGALIYFGGLIGKMVLGQWALRPLLRRPAPPLAALVVGVALVFFAGLIPILGDLFWLLVTVTGMGAALLQVRESRAAPAPSGPAPEPAATSAGA